MTTVYKVLRESVGKHASRPFLHIPVVASKSYADEAVDYSYQEMADLVEAQKLIYSASGYGLSHRLAASMQYAVRSSHVLANTRLLESSKDGSEIVVKSNFQTVIYYRIQSVYAGTCTHKLRREGSDWRIVQKRVDLINCDADHKSIVIYI
jgi:3-phenylpropionate/cinnamic acid dioxygenase small subunit|tara:strand:- start:1039 stop:1491 length:453 start_codon:yes stop_codon:yes gene_type:complete